MVLNLCLWAKHHCCSADTFSNPPASGNWRLSYAVEGPLNHESEQMVAITVAELNCVEKAEATAAGFTLKMLFTRILQLVRKH